MRTVLTSLAEEAPGAPPSLDACHCRRLVWALADVFALVTQSAVPATRS